MTIRLALPSRRSVSRSLSRATFISLASLLPLACGESGTDAPSEDGTSGSGGAADGQTGGSSSGGGSSGGNASGGGNTGGTTGSGAASTQSGGEGGTGTGGTDPGDCPVETTWTSLATDGDEQALPSAPAVRPAVAAIVLTSSLEGLTLKFDYEDGVSSLASLNGVLTYTQRGVECSAVSGDVEYTVVDEQDTFIRLCGTVSAHCTDDDSALSVDLEATLSNILAARNEPCEPDQFGYCRTAGNCGALVESGDLPGTIPSGDTGLTPMGNCVQGQTCSFAAADDAGSIDLDAQYHCDCGFNGAWACNPTW